jgi:hypothetical protein
LLEFRSARLSGDVVRRMTGGAIVHDHVEIRPRFEGGSFRRDFVIDRGALSAAGPINAMAASASKFAR